MFVEVSFRASLFQKVIVCILLSFPVFLGLPGYVHSLGTQPLQNVGG